MPMVADLEVIVDITKVMDAIQCYKNNPGYEETLTLYEEILPEFKLLVKPAAAYTFTENNAGFAVSEASDCNKLVYCVVTLGQDICDRISEFFAEGNYLKGNLINAMADELLLYYEQQIYRKIKKEADLEGCGLTQKLMPCEKGFDPAYQEEIIEWFSKIEAARPENMSGYLLLPVKSLVYMYGADSEQLTAEVEHDCSRCDNIDCYMREKIGNDGQVKLTVIGYDGIPKALAADRTQSILTSLIQGGVSVAASCSGKGTCGKCKIKIMQGAVRLEQINYEKLQSAEIDEGVCLACRAYPEEDCTLQLLGIQEEQFSIVSGFSGADNGFLNNGFTIESLELSDEVWQNNSSLTEYIDSGLKHRYQYSHSALKKISALTETPPNKAISLIINKQTIVDICTDTKVRILGLAIDISSILPL
jgi:ferredoxin